MSEMQIPEDLQNWYNVAVRERTSDIKRRYTAEDCILLIERIARAEADNAKADKLLDFYASRFVDESRRADGFGVRSVPPESDVEIALKSQIEITNKERAAKEKAERDLADIREWKETLRSIPECQAIGEMARKEIERRRATKGDPQ